MLAAILTIAIGAEMSVDPTSGTYRPAGAPAAAWKVNDHHTLLWNDAPYIPVGVRIDGSEAAITQAKSAGITDALVKLAPNTDWSPAVKRLEAGGFKYMLAVDGVAPGAEGIAVQPQTYRVTGLTNSRKIEFNIPGATSALALLVTSRDSSVVKTSRVDTPGGKFSYDVDLSDSVEHVLLIYPLLTTQSRPDYWERFDLQRDTLLIALKKANLGPGFRGLVNPMGDYVTLSGEGSFVPTSPYFKMEFRRYLEERYRNIETAQRAWSLSVNDLETFDDLARLVPLWSGSRGVPYLWDPKTDKQYKCSSKICSYWGDLQAVINEASARRFDRLVSAIRQIVDAPVVQEWRGWNAPYEAAKPSLTGVGIKGRGTTPSEIADTAARGASSLLRWTSKGWLVATDIDTGEKSESAALGNALGDLSAMGARGFFFRTAHPEWLAGEARTADLSLSDWSPTPLFYPESAANPASPQRLPAGRYWLPSPGGGNRVDLGSLFYAYRYTERGKAFTALWTANGTGRVRLRMLEGKTAKFVTIDGSDPKVKYLKNGVELTLSTYPLLVTDTEEVPIPELALTETAAKFEELKKLAEAIHQDISQENYAFREAVSAFDRSPGGSFIQLRRAFWTATVRLAPYVWVEAEASKSTNFSEVVTLPGASSGACLSLSSPETLDPRGFFAEYTIPVRAENVEVWVAARVAPEARRTLKVFVGGQEMGILEEPIRPYGPGFAWYHMGSTALKGASMKIAVQVFGDGANDVQVDAILVAPGSFTPRGVVPPELLGSGQ